jgi:hypothetical protein
LREPVMQPTGHADGVISAVIDENLNRHSRWSRNTQILPQDQSKHYEPVHAA